MKTKAKNTAISMNASFRGGSPEPRPETKNSDFGKTGVGLWSWIPGSRAAPAPRNDAGRIGRFHPWWREPPAACWVSHPAIREREGPADPRTKPREEPRTAARQSLPQARPPWRAGDMRQACLTTTRSGRYPRRRLGRSPVPGAVAPLYPPRPARPADRTWLLLFPGWWGIALARGAGPIWLLIASSRSAPSRCAAPAAPSTTSPTAISTLR